MRSGLLIDSFSNEELDIVYENWLITNKFI